MKILAVALAAFASLAVAIPTTTASLSAPSIAAITAVLVSKSCFPQVQPVLPTSTATLPICLPPDARPCDELCHKYNCCRGSLGCYCLAEVLDELERNESLQGDKDAALRNINPQDIDLGSAANANFKCDTPCGAAKLGCCLMDTKAGKQCVCRKDSILKQRNPNQECSHDCQALLHSWESCLEKKDRETCDRDICRNTGIVYCDYPMCKLYATCALAQAVQTAQTRPWGSSGEIGVHG